MSVRREQRYRVAAIQMVSEPELAPNLAAAERLIGEAARAGARLVALPEYFCLLGRHETDKVKLREREFAGPIQEFLAGAARRHRVWLVGGTLPLECGDPARVRSACLVFDSTGRRVARYDKIHLFGFSRGAESYDESRTIEPGTERVALESPFGRLGLSICYDVRFPELYRAAGEIDVWFVPSAFTATTGRAHWETLLRARAIENLAYVVAPAQGGRHANGRQTHGHTMIIDPWGEVIARQAEGEAVVAAEFDLDRIAQARRELPALQHRKLR
ncbi:MAG: carbon-nitrogen hydrolase family protein [Betaproteobacteria bacterium]|nr:carbon-nitrogen hydrolase family protein [Betaproteobacteria bacterium]